MARSTVLCNSVLSRVLRNNTSRNFTHRPFHSLLSKYTVTNCHQQLRPASVPQTCSIKSGQYNPVRDEDEEQCWDGIYAAEIADFVVPKQGGGVVLDLTFGSGKHTEQILRSDEHVRVIAIDRDPGTKKDATRLKKIYPGRLCYLNIKYR